MKKQMTPKRNSTFSHFSKLVTLIYNDSFRYHGYWCFRDAIHLQWFALKFIKITLVNIKNYDFPVIWNGDFSVKKTKNLTELNLSGTQSYLPQEKDRIPID